MFSLRHPNCVQLMGTVTSPPCLVTEYCARGSLTDCLRVRCVLDAAHFMLRVFDAAGCTVLASLAPLFPDSGRFWAALYNLPRDAAAALNAGRQAQPQQSGGDDVAPAPVSGTRCRQGHAVLVSCCRKAYLRAAGCQLAAGCEMVRNLT